MCKMNYCVVTFRLYVSMTPFSTVSKHSTSKLTWSECMDFSDTHIHVVSELGDLKKFLNQGLNLWIEEEKVQKI